MDTGRGSFRVVEIEAYGDWLLITDTKNRTRLYSVSAGKEMGTLFGSHSTLSREAGLLCVENEPGQVGLYDLKSLEKRGQLAFSNAVSYAQFSADGKRLLVLTSNQNVYVLDASALRAPKAANADHR